MAQQILFEEFAYVPVGQLVLITQLLPERNLVPVQVRQLLKFTSLHVLQSVWHV